MRRHVLMLCVAVGCAADDDKPTEAADSGSSATTDSGSGATTDSGDDTGGDTDPCVATALQADWTVDDSLGPMGDPVNWSDLPPDAIVSSTFLRLQDTPEAREAFQAVLGPVFEHLMAPADGLLGISTGGSGACGTVRTLTVWEDEDAMMAFVVGEAHMNAITRTGDISRGDSITDHWRVDELPEVSWTAVAAALEAHDGPVY